MHDTPGNSKPRALEIGRTRKTWSEFRHAGRGKTTLLGKRVPFIGRRTQLEGAYDAVRDALNKREVRIAWIHGAAGVGKSRLLAELERAVAPDRRGVGWMKVNTATDGPPTLVGKVLLELLGGPEVMSAGSPWRHALRQLETLVGEKHATECMNIVAPLVGLLHPDEDEAARFRAREAPEEVAIQFAGSLLRTRGRAGPFVIRLDATRGGIEEVANFAKGMTEALSGIAAALLIEARIPPPRGVVGIEMALEPIDKVASTKLVQHLLRDLDGAPTGLLEELVQRGMGNPERLLDLVRGMVAARDIEVDEGMWRWCGHTDQGGAAFLPDAGEQGDGRHLPDRLARLPAELRSVLECAAVYGQVFWFGGVLSVLRGVSTDPTAAMTDQDRSKLKQSLMHMQGMELITYVEHSKMSRELQFRFEHPGDAARLTAALPAERRRRVARLAGQWLNARPRQDPVADAARIAELYQQGGRLRLAAERFLEAGSAARGVGQVQRAVSLFSAGAQLTDTDDADLGADLRVAHGGGLLRLSRHADAEPVLLEALRLARCLDDDVRCGIAQLRVAQVARVSGRYGMALKFLEGALKHLRVAGAHRWISDVMDEIGLVHLVRGERDAYRQALAHFLKALALRRRAADRRVVARSLCHIAQVQLARGHFDDAQDAAQEALQIGEQIEDRWGRAKALLVLGQVHGAAGKTRAALAVWSQAIELAHEVGDPARRVHGVILQAEMLIASGRWQEGAAVMVDSLALAREINDPVLLSGIYRVQASISLERDALETADLDSQRAVEVARESGARVQVALAQLVRGAVLGTRALTETGANVTAVDHQATDAFEDALTTLGDMGDLVHRHTGLLSYANFLQQRGGGPRLADVEQRLAAVEADLAQVSGRA
ncbi:MAG: tetratricopeptide repeat protein [Myxococcales bacterium]|nr:tetratricopeptide repeat protein [Myxococcales bacterium]